MGEIHQIEVEKNNLYYAGIGSRETPKHIQDIMHHIGCYLYAEGWTLRSGAANGADTAFETAANTMEMTQNGGTRKEIYLPWKGFNNNLSELHPLNYPFRESEQNFSKHFHPAWDRCSPSAKLLHCRNTRIIFGHKAFDDTAGTVKFVVCWTPSGLITGGTAQAIRIAQAYKIPIINLGAATNPQYLEELVLEVDRIQNEMKGEMKS